MPVLKTEEFTTSSAYTWKLPPAVPLVKLSRVIFKKKVYGAALCVCVGLCVVRASVCTCVKNESNVYN